MPLSIVNGEFGIVSDPEIRFTTKGTAWAKVRGVSKDRTRDAAGNWTDSDPTFIDIVVFGKPAEHLTESVVKGDSILVTGKLAQKEWEDKEGNKQTNYQITAESIGVSLRWGPAKTGKASASVPSMSSIKESLGAESIEEPDFMAPF
jgi:single-strand DNA-binding protein